MYDRFNSLGDYKRNFKIHLMMQRNDARYDKTGDLWDSLEEVKARIFYSQNRVGFGYELSLIHIWLLHLSQLSTIPLIFSSSKK